MIKKYQELNVLEASRGRISEIFNNFNRIYLSFSGGKDSTVMLHLVMSEAVKRNRIIGLLIIDLEAQYNGTISHIENMVKLYSKNIELHWVCVPLLLRNAVSNFEPRWTCWDEDKKEIWVRNKPKYCETEKDYPFFVSKMEFEEFMVLFGSWYARGENCAAFIGIRADESLDRFRTISSKIKETYSGNKWTTKINENLYNVYPIYDWKTRDIWIFHAKFPELKNNPIYDKMYKAGLSISQMRLCQPYGDDQRRGLWLYHILEPKTWFKLIARVNGANSGALYINENGNINGCNKITKPKNHTWESFSNLLLGSLPKKTREHYIGRFRGFIKGWKGRGYEIIPDEAPRVLEEGHWAPSWRRICKAILRNDYWCKGLGLTQPKSAAYGKYLEIRKERKTNSVGKEPEEVLM